MNSIINLMVYFAKRQTVADENKNGKKFKYSYLFPSNSGRDNIVCISSIQNGKIPVLAEE